MCDVRKVTARAAADFVLLCAVICMTACVNGNDTYTGSGAPRTYKAFVQALEETEGGESPGNPVDIAFAGTEDASEIYRALSNAGKYVRLDLSESTVTGFGTGQYLSGQAKIVSLILPYNLEHLNPGAFSGWTQLKEVLVPDSVITVGSEAFYGCTSLSEVTLLDSVTAAATIGEYAFCGCTSLTQITIPGSVILIDRDAFSLCANLDAVTFMGDGTCLADDSVFPGGARLRNVAALSVSGKYGTGPYFVSRGTYKRLGETEWWRP